MCACVRVSELCHVKFYPYLFLKYFIIHLDIAVECYGHEDRKRGTLMLKVQKINLVPSLQSSLIQSNYIFLQHCSITRYVRALYMKSGFRPRLVAKTCLCSRQKTNNDSPTLNKPCPLLYLLWQMTSTQCLRFKQLLSSSDPLMLLGRGSVTAEAMLGISHTQLHTTAVCFHK